MNLDDVKAGDFVAHFHGGWYAEMDKVAVTRTTKTTITVGNSVYNRRGRLRGGDSYSRNYIEPWNDETHGKQLEAMTKEKRRRGLERVLSAMRWQDMDLEKLERVYKEAKPQKEQQ